MTILVVVLFAVLGVRSLVSVWRAVSCARFQRALRSYAVARDDSLTDPPTGLTVVDARHRFAQSSHDPRGTMSSRSA
jgi:hypothetical protein